MRSSTTVRTTTQMTARSVRKVSSSKRRAASQASSNNRASLAVVGDAEDAGDGAAEVEAASNSPDSLSSLANPHSSSLVNSSNNNMARVNSSVRSSRQFLKRSSHRSSRRRANSAFLCFAPSKSRRWNT